MKAQTITITTTELNTFANIQKDMLLTIGTESYYPTSIIVTNGSAISISFCFLTEGELEDFAVNPGHYAQYTLANGSAFNSNIFSKMGKNRYLIVKGVSGGSATAAVTFYLTGYMEAI